MKKINHTLINSTVVFFLVLAGVPPGNISSVDWSQLSKVTTVDCVPLNLLLHKAHARHINFFILDVEVITLLLLLFSIIPE